MKSLDYYLNKTKKQADCLEWTGCYNSDGYPRAVKFGYSNGKVHRMVWELANKKDPKNYVIRHTCDNIRCINPNHLTLGTNVENIKDRVLRDRSRGLKQAEVLQIQNLYKEGGYYKDICKLFGISYRTFYYTINKRKAG